MTLDKRMIDVLSRNCLPVNGSDDPLLTAMGIQFGPTCEDDPRFCQAMIPDGWVKKPTDHIRWINIYDERGRNRVRVFYDSTSAQKTGAFITPERRFWLIPLYVRENENVVRGTIKDRALPDIYGEPSIVFQTKRYKDSEGNCIKVDKEVRAWLSTHYPNWEDRGAYWD